MAKIIVFLAEAHAKPQMRSAGRETNNNTIFSNCCAYIIMLKGGNWIARLNIMEIFQSPLDGIDEDTKS